MKKNTFEKKKTEVKSRATPSIQIKKSLPLKCSDFREIVTDNLKHFIALFIYP